MSLLRRIRRSTFNLVLKFASENTLVLLEREFQDAQGKGWGGSTTAREASEVERFIKLKNIEKVFALDVGANLGNWSFELMRLNATAQIAAFEPSKAAFEKLLSRFDGNRNFQAVNVALGKEDNTSVLYADASGSGLASLTKRRLIHFGANYDYQETIQVRTLDSWLRDSGNGFKPNVLKIDVEGHELDVLSGATESLEMLQIIQFEFGGCNIDTRTFFQDLWYFFSESGFVLYRISSKGVSLVAHYSESDEVFRATNFIAVRQ